MARWMLIKQLSGVLQQGKLQSFSTRAATSASYRPTKRPKQQATLCLGWRIGPINCERNDLDGAVGKSMQVFSYAISVAIDPCEVSHSLRRNAIADRPVHSMLEKQC